MGVDEQGSVKRKRSGWTAGEGVPASKKPSLPAQSFSSRQREKIRSTVGTIYQHYSALLQPSSGQPDSLQFQAILDAAQGDCASKRLAARLIPRFIHHFPEQADTAAAILIDLHECGKPSECHVKHLEDLTRHDALLGLGSVVHAAHKLGSRGQAATTRVLEYLLRLLPTTAETESTDDGQEEGEVAAFSTSGNRRLIKQLLQSVFVQTPTLVLNFATAATQQDDKELQEGARQLLGSFLLQRRQPREPQQLLLLGAGMAPAEAGAALAAPIAAADEEVLASLWLPVGRGLGTNGQQQANPAAVDAAGEPPKLGCHMSRVAEVAQGHKGLQQWVSEHLVAGGPPEVCALCKNVQEELPDIFKAARPSQAATAGAAGTASGSGASTSGRQQQGPALGRSYTMPSATGEGGGGGSGSRQRAGAAAGPVGDTMPIAVNGVERLARFPSAPVDPASVFRDDAWEPSSFLPLPGGPICVALACLLLSGVPKQCTRQAVATTCKAQEAWLVEPDAAFCTFSSPEDAARCYQRMSGNTPWQLPGATPLVCQFAASYPSYSAVAPKLPPSSYIWVSNQAGCKPEEIAPLILEAGLPQLLSVRRVGGQVPGALAQASGHAEAQQAAEYLNHRLVRGAAGVVPQGGAVLGTPAAAVAAAAAGAAAAAAAAAVAASGMGQMQPPLPPMPPDPGRPGSSGGPGAGGYEAGYRAGGLPPSPGGGRRPTSLWVGSIPPELKEGELLELFRQFGRLADHKLIPQSNCGFVTFADAVAAQRALEALHGRPVGARRQQLKVEWAQRQPTKQSPFRAGEREYDLRGNEREWDMRGIGAEREWDLRGVGPGTRAGQGSPNVGSWESVQKAERTNRDHARGAAAAAGGTPGPWGRPPESPPPPLPPGLPPGVSWQQQHQLYPGATHTPGYLPGHTPGVNSVVTAGGTARHPHMLHHAPGGPSPFPGHPGDPPLPAGPYPGSAAPPSRAPPAATGNGVQQVMWTGVLRKSNSTMCSLRCLDNGGMPQPSAREPYGWPEALEVNHRVKFPDVFAAYHGASEHQRAVRLLLPGSAAEDPEKLKGFIKYLREKDRAGLAKVPRRDGVPARNMYLMAPSGQLCRELRVQLGANEGGDQGAVLLAVVVPDPHRTS